LYHIISIIKSLTLVVLPLLLLLLLFAFHRFGGRGARARFQKSYR
jgi:hypothetical protein